MQTAYFRSTSEWIKNNLGLIPKAVHLRGSSATVKENHMPYNQLNYYYFYNGSRGHKS